jgi:hypothetical protein
MKFDMSIVLKSLEKVLLKYDDDNRQLKMKSYVLFSE